MRQDNLTGEVDRLAGERVLVIGSLPPAGRDLDLLVRPAAAAALESGLSKLGYGQSAGKLAKFPGGRPAIVELHPVESWGLPEPEVNRLFAEAWQLPGTPSLALPAPHHVLLITARAMPDQPWGLKKTQLARVERALRDDSAAFERAGALAPAWRLKHSLGQLRRLVASGRPPSAVSRARARQERDGKLPLRSLLPVPQPARRLLRKRERGSVVALSGLDGSGKSTQARRLADALSASGQPSSVVWDSLISSPRAIRRIAEALRRGAGIVLRGSTAEPPREAAAPVAAAGTPVVDEPAAPERLANLGGWRGAVVSHGWAFILTAALGSRLARATWPRILRGEAVVCDRYLLDAAVELRYFYGDRSFRPQLALLRLLTPAPANAFLIDVDPVLAAERKGEFNGDQNARRAALYAENAPRERVTRIDGSGEPDEIADRLMTQVWLDLGRPDSAPQTAADPTPTAEASRSVEAGKESSGAAVLS